MPLSLLCASAHQATPSLSPGNTLDLMMDAIHPAFYVPATPSMLRRVAAAVRDGALVFTPGPTWPEIEADVAERTAQIMAQVEARLAHPRTTLDLAS